MKANEKKMLIALIILLSGLAVKSFFMDPYRPESDQMAQYAEFAQLMAPFQQQTMLDRMKVLNYQTVDVERIKEEGQTHIAVLEPDTDGIAEIELSGEYEARVRAYLFWIFPIRDIHIEGGLPAHENKPGS
ncbi:MAG: hypothetical protein D5S00_11410 [Tindallia sp. MSAO_Bac2]|nr:MAG: hypothetical protein D5S00_11410 [Tindallia sp. MSAO_Bac2]